MCDVRQRNRRDRPKILEEHHAEKEHATQLPSIDVEPKCRNSLNNRLIHGECIPVSSAHTRCHRGMQRATSNKLRFCPYQPPLNVECDSICPQKVSKVTARLMNGLRCESLFPAQWQRRHPPQPRLRSLRLGTSLFP